MPGTDIPERTFSRKVIENSGFFLGRSSIGMTFSKKSFRSNCFIISKPFINGRIINSYFLRNRTNRFFLLKNFFHPLYFFFWRNLIHKKCPLSDKQFYFFNCLPKREHTRREGSVQKSVVFIWNENLQKRGIFLQFSIEFCFSGCLVLITNSKLVIYIGKRRGFSRSLWFLLE